jgi:ABC-2 type transport system ATP-binding protein
MALAAGLPASRAEEVLQQVALTEHADRRVGGFSLGMRQRLALAQALLGDPPVLVLDEPANGLDPAGIAWLRGFLRALAEQGRTVLVSSHVLSEVQQTVDDVVVIARGRLMREASLSDLASTSTTTVARTPTPDRLLAALSGWPAEHRVDGAVRVPGRTPAEVGHAAFEHGVELHELGVEPGELERLFLELTSAEEEVT